MPTIKKAAVVTTIVVTPIIAIPAFFRYTKLGRFMKDCGKFGWDYVTVTGNMPPKTVKDTAVELFYIKHFGK